MISRPYLYIQPQNLSLLLHKQHVMLYYMLPLYQLWTLYGRIFYYLLYRPKTSLLSIISVSHFQTWHTDPNSQNACQSLRVTYTHQKWHCSRSLGPDGLDCADHINLSLCLHLLNQRPKGYECTSSTKTITALIH